ncbi:MAG: alkaline phosphatase family protein [Verrucomicrobiae bacterium]|nr:alkaline phosphatase family protein [Verrucomicrobiae bacterium]MDW7980493.1 alkaline phosphatase family protein [Verrucomicrobiales bacterium]
MSIKLFLRTLCAAATLALFGCATGSNTSSTALEPPCNVVLIGWDGAARERVSECMANGELPALSALAGAGSFRKIDIRGGTDSTAGWAQILTGYDPEVTSAWSNERFGPIPQGLSLFERLKEQFGDRIVTLAVIAKEHTIGRVHPPFKVPISESATGEPWNAAPSATAHGHDEPVPERIYGAKIVEEGGIKYRVYPGSPWLHMRDACDQWVFGLGSNESVTAKALELIEQHKGKRLFLFVHFAEPDATGHTYGENSPEYKAALMATDACTGRIIAKLKQLGLWARTYVYVTADHGFDEAKKTHRRATRVFLVTNDPQVSRDGDRADIAPTILSRFGIDVRKLAPPLAGTPLNMPSENR